MNAGLPGPVVTATITGTGVLTVWGLDPTPRVLDEGAPPAARNALVNLLHTAAQDRGQVVCAAARTPAGPWYFACNPHGVIAPLDPAHFTAVTLPDLDTPIVLAGAAAVFAAAAGSPPAAMLALASDPDPAIRAEALAELATWPDDPTPVADAELPADRLELLAGCHLGWVRVGVAANPGTGHTALVRLVADDDPQVLATLAGRFDLPVDLLVQLATTGDPHVQAELARNPSAAFLTADQTVPSGQGDEIADDGRATPHPRRDRTTHLDHVAADPRAPPGPPRPGCHRRDHDRRPRHPRADGPGHRGGGPRPADPHPHPGPPRHHRRGC